MENKSFINYNFLDFSYKCSSISEYLNENLLGDFAFNNQIVNEIEYLKPLPSLIDYEILFVRKEIVSFDTPSIQLTSLQFLNLFYHELNFIKENKFDNSLIRKRLSSISLPNFDRLYLYSKLTNKLKSLNDGILNIAANNIADVYKVSFNAMFKSRNSEIWAIALTKALDIELELKPTIREKLEKLYEYSLSKEGALDENPQIDSAIRSWIEKKLVITKNLKNDGFGEYNVSENLLTEIHNFENSPIARELIKEFKKEDLDNTDFHHKIFNSIKDYPEIHKILQNTAKEVFPNIDVTDEMHEIRDFLSMKNHLKAEKCKNNGNEPTEIEKMRQDLIEYGFFGLPKVCSLTMQNQTLLVEKLISKDVPYRIAMFEFLGFLKHLEKTNLKTKGRIHKVMSQWFGATERTIKGNVNALKPYTTENKERYTSSKHIKDVENDYNTLK